MHHGFCVSLSITQRREFRCHGYGRSHRLACRSERAGTPPAAGSTHPLRRFIPSRRLYAFQTPRHPHRIACRLRRHRLRPRARQRRKHSRVDFTQRHVLVTRAGPVRFGCIYAEFLCPAHQFWRELRAERRLRHRFPNGASGTYDVGGTSQAFYDPAIFVQGTASTGLGIGGVIGNYPISATFSGTTNTPFFTATSSNGAPPTRFCRERMTSPIPARTSITIRPSATAC